MKKILIPAFSAIVLGAIAPTSALPLPVRAIAAIGTLTLGVWAITAAIHYWKETAK